MTVQDAASALAAAVADLKPGSTVLDCCAAPGGKSFAMAEKNHGERQRHLVRYLRAQAEAHPATAQPASDCRISAPSCRTHRSAV